MQQVLDESPVKHLSRAADTVVPVSTIISVVALLVSLGVAWRTFTHDPLGSGIDAYNFTTAKDALLSQLDMSINRDMRANFELMWVKAENAVKEKRESVRVHSESEYQGKKLLFVSFQENGVPKNAVEAFEKDAQTGFWFPTYVSTYGMDDPSLEKAIKEWRDKARGTGSAISKWEELADALE